MLVPQKKINNKNSFCYRVSLSLSSLSCLFWSRNCRHRRALCLRFSAISAKIAVQSLSLLVVVVVVVVVVVFVLLSSDRNSASFRFSDDSLSPFGGGAMGCTCRGGGGVGVDGGGGGGVG